MCLYYGSWTIFTLTLLSFVAFSITAIVSANKFNKDYYFIAFTKNRPLIKDIFAYSFLSQFVILSVLTIALITETRKCNYGRNNSNLRYQEKI